MSAILFFTSGDHVHLYLVERENGVKGFFNDLVVQCIIFEMENRVYIEFEVNLNSAIK